MISQEGSVQPDIGKGCNDKIIQSYKTTLSTMVAPEGILIGGIHL